MLAHRGLATHAPENTILAFANAVALGATHIETDVHASRDGVAIISHDPDLSRVAGRAQRVDELTLEELRRVELGAGQTYATLAEALDAFPGTRFNIDVKSAAAAGPAAAAITAAGAGDRVLVTSFSDARRRAALRALPGTATSASAGSFLAALVAAKLALHPLVRLALRRVDAVQVPVKAAGLRIDTRRVIRAMRAAGVEVHFWTINDPAEMARLFDLGADGIITDRADLAIPVVNGRRVAG